MPVYGEFDSAGNYICNPFKSEVETNIYISTVEQISNKLDVYTKSFPNSSPQQRHDVIINDTKEWDLYNKSKQCLQSLGINPDEVTPLSVNVEQAIAVPEFGPIDMIILTMSIIGLMLLAGKRLDLTN